MANYSFDDLVDLIGPPVESWPRKILACYMKSAYNFSDRFALCIFNFTNGFDNKIFLEVALAKGALRDQAVVQHIQNIIQILEKGEEHLDEWYSFNVVENRWTYLNGQALLLLGFVVSRLCHFVHLAG